MTPTEPTEPQDVAEIGPTPYSYLFAETIEREPDFEKKVKKALKKEENV